ncbi:1-deoxy-D-xylulose 5-phosphate reductoisomerase [Ewingella americana]
MNAANEVSVAAFLAGHIRFTDIANINREVMQQSVANEPQSVEEVLEIDRAARASAHQKLQTFAL